VVIVVVLLMREGGRELDGRFFIEVELREESQTKI
jgi:hypothetical protein